MTVKRNNLRIAFLLPALSNKGPEAVARDIISNIINEVQEVKVFYFDSIRENGFECQTQQISFFEKIDFENFDVIHTHGLRPDIYLNYHRPRNINKVSTLHSNVFVDLISQKGKTVGWLAAKIWVSMLSHHKIAVLSNDLKQFYSSKISKPESRLVTIYNGRTVSNNGPKTIENSEKEQIEKLRNSTKTIIGCASVLIKRKGIDQLIKALSTNKNLGLIILGNGSEEENLKSLSISLNVDDRILFLGFKLNPSIYFKYFDVFALTSHSEGMPLGLLEAIQLKKPSVVSNLPIYDELFDNNEVAIFELNNVEDLVDKILYASKNADSLIEKALLKVEQNYSSQIMAQKYLNIYEG